METPSSSVKMEAISSQLCERIRILNRLHGRYTEGDDFVIYKIHKDAVRHRVEGKFIIVDSRNNYGSHEDGAWIAFVLDKVSYLVRRVIFELIVPINHIVSIAIDLFITIHHSDESDDHFAGDYRIDLGNICRENCILRVENDMLKRSTRVNPNLLKRPREDDGGTQLSSHNRLHCHDCEKDLPLTSFSENVHYRDADGVRDETRTRIRYRTSCHACRKKRYTANKKAKMSLLSS